MHKELHNFRTLAKQKLYDFLFISHLILSGSLRLYNVCVFITCMYRLSKTVSCGVCVRLGKFIPFVFICLLVRSLGLLNVARSLLSFDHLHDGVFNEIGDRLIRRQHKMYNFPKSSLFYMCVCALFFMAVAVVVSILEILLFHFKTLSFAVFAYAFNRRNERRKKKQSNNSNIKNVEH